MLSKGTFEEHKDRQNKIDMENKMLKFYKQDKFKDYINDVVAPWAVMIVIGVLIFVIHVVALSFWK